MSYNRTRLTPEQRRIQIINSAIDQAIKRGLYKFNIKNVAFSNCSKSTVKHYFKTITALRNEVIRHALSKPDLFKLVGQAVVMKDDVVAELTDTERRYYLQRLID